MMKTMDSMTSSKANNYILEYWQQIETGQVTVSRKVRKLYKRLVDEILNPKDPWIYDNNKALHVINFIERYCKHSKGKWGGKPVILELWEKALLSAAFGFVDKFAGLRKYTEVLLIVARKNGKSTLAAAVGLYLMIADGEPGAEVYAAATKEDQAKIIWKEAKRMVKKSPALSKRIKCLVKEIVGQGKYEDSFFRPLGSDSDTLDGLNVHGALMDEIHAWKDKNLFDVIADGMTAREQPMLFLTTTAGTIRELVYDEKYDYASKVIDGIDGFEDERLLPVIYELDKREEWTDPTCWVKANPGLGTIKNLQKLAEKVERAKRVPSAVSNLLTKDFNIRETSSEAWLTFEVLNNTATFDLDALKPRYGIGGTDLSKTTDLTAAKVIFMIPGDPHIYVLQMYWLPEELLERRTSEDKIPYDIWHKRGFLRTCPGNSVHPKYVTEWYREVMNEKGIYLPWIGYDAWSAKYWVEEMQGYFGAEAMIPVIQGKKTLSGPMQKLGADLESKLVIYNNNPIDKWCLSNTAVEIDKNLNIQPCKTNNQRRRIDGTSALLNAYVVLQDKMQDYMNMI